MKETSEEKGMNPKFVTLVAIVAVILGGVLVAFNYHLQCARAVYCGPSEARGVDAVS